MAVYAECPVCFERISMSANSVTYCVDEDSSWLTVDMPANHVDLAHRCHAEEPKTI